MATARPRLQRIRFVEGRHYTNDQIGTLGGPPQWYLPMCGGMVVAARLRKDLNPKAPNVILVGKGLIIEKSAKALRDQGSPIPVFVKTKGTTNWRYCGEYAFRSHHLHGRFFDAAINPRHASEISMVIRLRKIE